LLDATEAELKKIAAPAGRARRLAHPGGQTGGGERRTDRQDHFIDESTAMDGGPAARQSRSCAACGHCSKNCVMRSSWKRQQAGSAQTQPQVADADSKNKDARQEGLAKLI
jgi:hypothetical protein